MAADTSIIARDIRAARRIAAKRAQAALATMVTMPEPYLFSASNGRTRAELEYEAARAIRAEGTVPDAVPVDCTAADETPATFNIRGAK